MVAGRINSLRHHSKFPCGEWNFEANLCRICYIQKLQVWSAFACQHCAALQRPERWSMFPCNSVKVSSRNESMLHTWWRRTKNSCTHAKLWHEVNGCHVSSWPAQHIESLVIHHSMINLVNKAPGKVKKVAGFKCALKNGFTDFILVRSLWKRERGGLTLRWPRSCFGLSILASIRTRSLARTPRFGKIWM